MAEEASPKKPKDEPDSLKEANSMDWAQTSLGKEVAIAIGDNRRETDHISHRVRTRGINPQTGSPRYGLAMMRLSDLPPERLKEAGLDKPRKVQPGRWMRDEKKGRLVRVD